MYEGRARPFSESEDETRDHEDAEAGGEHERQHSERPYERENDQQSGHRSGSAAGFGAELPGGVERGEAAGLRQRVVPSPAVRVAWFWCHETKRRPCVEVCGARPSRRCSSPSY